MTPKAEEAPEQIWLLRNEDGSFDDCWQPSTLSGTLDIPYTRADRVEAVVRAVLDIVAFKSWDGDCFCAVPPSPDRSHSVHCERVRRQLATRLG